MKKFVLLASIAVLLGTGLLIDLDSARAQGFRLENKRLTVARARDWNEWSLGSLQEPVGEIRQDVISIDPRGRLTPRLIRKSIEAVSDAPTFIHIIDGRTEKFYTDTFKEGGKLFARGGIKNAGSNFNRAARVIDRGDNRLQTFWEPDLERPDSEWWLEIDLGRVVLADKVTLRFVDEELGDPFMQFRVLISDGFLAFGNSETLDYRIVGGTTQPVEDQRSFEYTLEPYVKVSPGFRGTPVQYLRIVVTDSRLDRAARIDSATHGSLLEDQQGAVDYLIKTFDGSEVPVSAAEYESVAPDRRAPIRYHRRERPRLADVEVHTAGDNIGLGIRQRGGLIQVSGTDGHIPADAFDGDYRTYWKAQSFAEVGSGSSRGGKLTVDLGSTFWMESYRLLPNNPGRPLLGYMARVSDGSRASDGSLVWDTVSPEGSEINSGSIRHFEDVFSPRQVRFFEFKHVDGTGSTSGVYGAQYPIGEIQLYGQGYVPEVKLTSPLIELASTQNLNRINWVGDIPPGTSVELRTQTGNELKAIKKFFDTGGREVTREKYYNQLASFQRGDSTVVYSAGVDWSPWSNAYENSGAPFLSPSPRQYLKIQARLLSTHPDLFATLDSLIVHFTDPIGHKLLAEISPQTNVARVVADTFSLYLRSQMVNQPSRERSLSFDEIRVVASQKTAMELLQVSLGTRQQVLADSGEVFRANGGGEFLNEAGDRLLVHSDASDSLWFTLPRRVVQDPEIEQIYHRIAMDGDEAPLDKRGKPLNRRNYKLLPEGEQGRIDYFRITSSDDEGNLNLQKIAESSYKKLDFAEQGPVRYYRRLFEGEEINLDNNGEVLTQSAWRALPSSRRGIVLEEGELVEVRFRSHIFLNGTTFSTQLARSDKKNSWQHVDSGNALAQIDGTGTAIFFPIDDQILHSLEIGPNPFTPNGDQINDRLRLVVSVLKIDAPRSIRARFYSLGGKQVAEVSTMAIGGPQVLEWDGRDRTGARVPPGLYLCHVYVDTDSASANEQVRVISVVY